MTSKYSWCRVSSLGFFLPPLILGSIALAEDRPTENPSQPNQQATSGSSTPTESPISKDGWRNNADAGFIYQKSDFRWTLWGYGERIINPQGESSWRRVRQGMEFDLPRFSDTLRPAFVYEVDLTDNYFFTQGPNWKILENLFLALQNPDDPGQLRVR